MPGAGVHLTRTLYSRAPPTDSLEDLDLKWNVFDRKPMDQRSIDRKSFASKSSDDGSNVPSLRATVYRFADFVTSLSDVSTESAVFVDLIQRVRRDADEAQRLYSDPAVSDYLESWPDKKSWIDHILYDVNQALERIGNYVQNARVAADESGVVWMKHKFEWVIRHQHKLKSRQDLLKVCHESLLNAIQVMQRVELGAGYETGGEIFEAPAAPLLQHDQAEALRGPNSRQKWRVNQRNRSVPSITVSEYEDKGELESLFRMPAELPGSTPNGPADLDDWDLYTAPPKAQTTSKPLRTQQSPDLKSRSSLDLDGPVLQKQASLEEVKKSARRATSFDQIRLPSQTRNVFDLPASSAQIASSYEIDGTKHRASVDQVSSLPTVDEKLDESTYNVNGNEEPPFQSSNTEDIPILARRYRPKAVQVRRPRAKHHSLPDQLPRLPHQTSLISELSSWVFLSEDSDSFPSTATSLETETPSTSVTSSPVLPNTPASCPSGFRPVPVLTRYDSSSTTQDTPGQTTDNSSEPQVNADLPAMPILSSSATTSFSQALSKKPFLFESSSPIETRSAPKENQIVPPVVMSAEVQPAEEGVQLSTSKEQTATEAESTLSSDPRLPLITEDPESATMIKWKPINRGSPTTPSPPPLSNPLVLVPSSNGTTSPQPTKPMTSQAKRRRAHTRRMQAAYGSDN